MPDPYSRIFLLSHMRAFTSLAGHILGSHPEINGYFEMHLSYEARPVLARQLELIREGERLKRDSRYLFDKLLHNDYRLEPEKLGLGEVQMLVCLREPEQSIRSIVNLFARKETEELYASPEAAAGYYVERLQWLAEFCSLPGRRYRYFDAAAWQEAPELLLATLSGWLGLQTPLEDSYGIFSRTGEPGRGDSSPRMMHGRISRGKSDYSAVEIPYKSLQQALEVYWDCRERIVHNAVDCIAL